MALPPKFRAFRLTFTGSNASDLALDAVPAPLHTVELYLDYVCPYSASELSSSYDKQH